MSKSWYTEREFNADANPEAVCQDGFAKLNSERHRHEDEMERLKKEHEEKLRKLEESRLKKLKNWISQNIWWALTTMKLQLFIHIPRSIKSSFVVFSQHVINSTLPRTQNTRSQVQESTATDSQIGQENFTLNSSENESQSCLIVWNDSHGNESQARALSQAFLDRGFEVQMKRNLSERDTWNLFQNVGDARYQEKRCFVLVFISKGTTEHMRSNDGKKIKLSNIVNFFSPYNAQGLRRTPKLLFFQCDGENKGEKMWQHDEYPFTPKYNDAFVLCSTHSRFLPTLTEFVKHKFVGEFQDIMSKVSDELVRGSTEKESIGMASTLRNKLVFGQK